MRVAYSSEPLGFSGASCVQPMRLGIRQGVFKTNINMLWGLGFFEDPVQGGDGGYEGLERLILFGRDGGYARAP